MIIYMSQISNEIWKLIQSDTYLISKIYDVFTNES